MCAKRNGAVATTIVRVANFGAPPARRSCGSAHRTIEDQPLRDEHLRGPNTTAMPTITIVMRTPAPIEVLLVVRFCFLL
jgi:hypothetical protein